MFVHDLSVIDPSDPMMNLNNSLNPSSIISPLLDHGDHKHRSSSSYNNNNMVMESSTNVTSTTPVRVCSDCNTTKTPLWRSGPRGPKSLCNACGIRQRKARRRAMAVAAANGSSSSKAKIITNAEEIKTSNHIGHDHQYSLLPYNKRFRDDHIISYNKNDHHHHGITKDSCFEDFFISLNKKLAFHRVFPKDEEEAAILLMAISSGLVHGSL